MLKMYTLGHDFVPPGIHAGGLRYHGNSAVLSQLYHEGLLEGQAYPQLAVFASALTFARSEGILPAPESSHAIHAAIVEARRADEEGKSKAILFNLSGHGYFDLAAYDDFLNGRLQDHEHPAEAIEEAWDGCRRSNRKTGRGSRTKNCGVTPAGDALIAASCGADAVGLNFYRGSKRYVPEDAAREIVRAVGSRAEVVAVFVNESPEEVVGLCGRLGIRRVQLHGDEPAGNAARIGLWRMKAVHAEAPVDFEALADYPCEAFLVDAGGPGGYGARQDALLGRLSERFARLGKPGSSREG
jgi:hypothetical protein